jgi:uncharacterized protein YbbC (DUF1343 family)
LIGAPFINSTDLAEKLNALQLPGVKFRAASFIPTFSKYANILSHGVQIHVTDRSAFRSVRTSLAVVKTIHDMYPNNFQFFAENSSSISFFDQLAGNGWIRKGINNGTSLKEMEGFSSIRKQYLLY